MKSERFSPMGEEAHLAPTLKYPLGCSQDEGDLSGSEVQRSRHWVPTLAVSGCESGG